VASAKHGLRTGHVARPNEHGPGRGESAPSAPVDVAGADLEDLAGKLGL
jgi:2-haloacid dehalogenase